MLGVVLGVSGVGRAVGALSAVVAATVLSSSDELALHDFVVVEIVEGHVVDMRYPSDDEIALFEGNRAPTQTQSLHSANKRRPFTFDNLQTHFLRFRVILIRLVLFLGLLRVLGRFGVGEVFSRGEAGKGLLEGLS